MTITTRAGKGSALTHAEMDENITDLRDGVNLVVPSSQTAGLKVDSLGTPGFGWHDLITTFYVDVDVPATRPVFATYLGNIKAFKFAVNNVVYYTFHIPHDYVMGSNIFLHCHWSHNGTLVTGGTVTWEFELTYAKGHNQAAFSAAVLGSTAQAASLVQYQHLIAEDLASVSGGSASLLDTDALEVDGLILGRMKLSADGITVSGGPQPDIFLHQIDLHYQSTGVPTKNKAPNFWGP